MKERVVLKQVLDAGPEGGRRGGDASQQRIAHVLGSGVVLIFFVWALMRRFASGAPRLKHLFVENLILLGFVTLTEFTFLLTTDRRTFPRASQLLRHAPEFCQQ